MSNSSPSSGIDLQVNGDSLTMPVGTTVTQLLIKIGITHAAVAVEIDSEICPADQRDSRVLKSGQVVEVVSLVGGG